MSIKHQSLLGLSSSGARTRQRGFLLNPYRFGGGSNDPWKSQVALHLRGDTLLDTSLSPKTLALTGSVVVSSDWKPVNIDTIKTMGGYFTVVEMAAFQWGLGDFTVEGYFKLDMEHTYGIVWCVGAYGFNGGFYGGFDGRTIIFGQLNPYAATLIGYEGNLDTLREGVHVAWVRASDGCHLFVAGVKVFSTARAQVVVAPDRVRIGDMNHYNGRDSMGLYPYKGWFGSVRMTSGARYMENFTPPTTPFF